MGLPYVSNELLTKLGNPKIDFQKVYDDMLVENPYLLEFIDGFSEYLVKEGESVTKLKFRKFGLAIYLALKIASEVTKRG